MKKKITKKDYEEYLNSISKDLSDDTYWIGGKLRLWYKGTEQYGTGVRRYDPIAFQAGYNEFVRDNGGQQ